MRRAISDQILTLLQPLTLPRDGGLPALLRAVHPWGGAPELDPGDESMFRTLENTKSAALVALPELQPASEGKIGRIGDQHALDIVVNVFVSFESPQDAIYGNGSTPGMYEILPAVQAAVVHQNVAGVDGAKYMFSGDSHGGYEHGRLVWHVRFAALITNFIDPRPMTGAYTNIQGVVSNKEPATDPTPVRFDKGFV